MGISYAFHEMGTLDKRASPKPNNVNVRQFGFVTIKDSEAADHIGEEVEVRGGVSSVYIKSDWLPSDRYWYSHINLAGNPPTSHLLPLYM